MRQSSASSLLSTALSAVCVCVWVAMAGCNDGTAPTNFTTDPAKAVFVTSDITNFWAAYDAGGKNGSTSVFQTQYLDRASDGLRDFIAARNLTAASLVQMVQAYPNFFAGIRANSLALANNAGILNTIRANYTHIAQLYPASVFPPVTFLIGRFSTGGTVRQSGMLVGSEFYSIDASTPLTELGTFQRTNVHALDSIPFIVAHEHAHILQGRVPGGVFSRHTLLDQSLMEGGADFVGELVSGGNINGTIYAYGFAHEAQLWAEFKTAMDGIDVSQWLYNQGTTTGSRPGDLGYFIGYRIAQAYYAKVTDKAAALRDIIELKDAKAFLAASGYAP